MNKPEVSIILPVYNSEKTLNFCLDSLMSLDFPKEKLEIIVVDYNSSDSTKDIIKRHEVIYLSEPKKGAAFALNRGIRNSRGEIIAITHSDCVVEKNWITNIIKGFRDSNIGGCGGEVLSYNPQSWIERYWDYRRLYFQDGNIAKGESILPWIASANVAFLRSVLDEVGLFDESFTDEYEIDLSWRFCLKGYQLKYIPDALVYHCHTDRATLSGFWHHVFDAGRSAPRFVKKYGKIYEPLCIVPYKDLLYIFWRVLYGFGKFFQNLFVEKDRSKIGYPLLDNIAYSALFCGSLSTWVSLKFQSRNNKFAEVNID